MKTAEDMLQDKGRQLVSVPPGATLGIALDTMRRENIGAVLIREGDNILGIWTERDLLNQVMEPGFDIKTACIRDYMRTDLKSAPADTPVERLTDMLLGLYIRHVLIIKEGQYIGLLSIGDVLRANLLKKDRDLKALNKIASWEYYENWGWHRKFKKRETRNPEKK